MRQMYKTQTSQRHSKQRDSKKMRDENSRTKMQRVVDKSKPPSAQFHNFIKY